MRRQPAFLQVVLASLFLELVGWGGLYMVIYHTLPTLGNRWLLFFFMMLGVCGLVYPLISLIHRRFQGKHPLNGSVAVREAIMIGLYVGLLAWLQQGGILDINRGMFLFIGFVIIEGLLLWYERSRWQPKSSDHE